MTLADELHKLQIAALKKTGYSKIQGALFAAEVEARRPNPSIPYIRNILKGISHATR